MNNDVIQRRNQFIIRTKNSIFGIAKVFMSPCQCCVYSELIVTLYHAVSAIGTEADGIGIDINTAHIFALVYVRMELWIKMLWKLTLENVKVLISNNLVVVLSRQGDWIA